jgi:hypothetical protein
VKTAAYVDISNDFSVPVELTDPTKPDDWDKPWISTLQSGARLVAWATETSSSITTARSTDGATWERATFAPDGTLRAVVVPCGAGAARAYLPYLVPGGVELTRTDDAGATFSAPARVDAAGDAVAFEAPSCAAAGDDVWVAYGLSHDVGTDDETPVLTGIVVAHSQNGGVSFSEHVAVDDATGAATLLPFLARAPSGRFDLVYYRGSMAGDSAASLRWLRSNDGAQWEPPVTLDAPLLLEPARNGLGWLGDYIGVQSADDAVLVTFAETGWSGTLSRVRFATGSVP